MMTYLPNRPERCRALSRAVWPLGDLVRFSEVDPSARIVGYCDSGRAFPYLVGCCAAYLGAPRVPIFRNIGASEFRNFLGGGY